MQSGWISLHRKIKDSVVYTDSDLLKLWIHCLLKATHTEYEQLVGNTVVKLQPGQFVTGRDALAEEFNKGVPTAKKCSAISLWRRLRTLEKLEMLNIKTTNKFSVVTVIKWHEYQDSEQQVNNKRTTSEQQVNTNNNSNNNNNNNNGRKQVYDETSPPFILAKYFLDQIRKNNPDHREPNLQTWSDDIRKMIELDGRDKKEIGQLMKWVQQDEFEMVNVLSPSKLRKRYDQLKMKMDRLPPKNEPAPPKYKKLG